MGINYKLLRRVKAQILKEPKQFAMAKWFNSEVSELGLDAIPNCGTAACIGGWAIALSCRVTPKQAERRERKSSNSLYSDRLASNLIGVNWKGDPVSWSNNSQAARLFNQYCWPEPFATRFEAAKTPAGRARVAARRIDHFIKTKGAE